MQSTLIPNAIWDRLEHERDLNTLLNPNEAAVENDDDDAGEENVDDDVDEIIQALNAVEKELSESNKPVESNKSIESNKRKRGRKLQKTKEPIQEEEESSEAELESETGRLLQIAQTRKRLRSANMERQDKNSEKIVIIV